MNEKKIVPFLRWAGGKRWLLKEIDRFVNIRNFNTYHEPFLGGGSIFIHLKPSKAIISDSNRDLINVYVQVRDKVDLLIEFLRGFNNSEEYYYSIRKKQFQDKTQEAAKFIYLNFTSFNGIYRVNKKGEYNVPYGYRINHVYDFDNLKQVSKLLQNTLIFEDDFDNSLNNIHEGDLVFLDPPYTVAHNNNGFIQYNQKIFSIEDQTRLSIFIQRIKEIGAFYIMTNAAHQSIKRIFANGDLMYEIHRASSVGGKNAKRGKYPELILTNLL